jgi:hypothetical protein
MVSTVGGIAVHEIDRPDARATTKEAFASFEPRNGFGSPGARQQFRATPRVAPTRTPAVSVGGC